MSGWGSLQAVLTEARTMPRLPGSCCPNDGTHLETGPGGILFCRFDGWRGTASQAEPAGPSTPDPFLTGYSRYY